MPKKAEKKKWFESGCNRSERGNRFWEGFKAKTLKRYADRFSIPKYKSMRKPELEEALKPYFERIAKESWLASDFDANEPTALPYGARGLGDLVMPKFKMDALRESFGREAYEKVSKRRDALNKIRTNAWGTIAYGDLENIGLVEEEFKFKMSEKRARKANLADLIDNDENWRERGLKEVTSIGGTPFSRDQVADALRILDPRCVTIREIGKNKPIVISDKNRFAVIAPLLHEKKGEAEKKGDEATDQAILSRM